MLDNDTVKILSISTFAAPVESVIGFWALAVTMHSYGFLVHACYQRRVVTWLKIHHEVINIERNLLTLINRIINDLFTATESSQVACIKHDTHRLYQVVRYLTANNQLPTMGCWTAEKELSC